MSGPDALPASGARSGSDAVPAFDLCGPLPTGALVLEASAGTGKTATIASLTVRYVAEGVVRLPELLCVTFGRLATSELRDRVRARLVDAQRALRDPSSARAGDDPVLALLATGTDVEVAARHSRLADALGDLDAATVTTTHGFCAQMLTVLGVGADLDPAARLLPDVAALREEVVDDLYLRKYLRDPAPVLGVEQARVIARAAVGDAWADLVPAGPDDGAWAHDTVGLARATRDELARRKRLAHVVDYDDQLTLLRDALTDPVRGPAAVARVRERYRVVMVDEFQDTDPVQWQILRTAFGCGGPGEPAGTALVLIGDPKQAVYAFRGADVATYLAAVGEIGRVATLDRNWRTDAAVLDGLAPLLAGTALGDPAIAVRPVSAVHTERRVVDVPPVLLRRVTRASFTVDDDRQPSVADVRRVVVADVVAQVVETLRVARLVGPDGERRPVSPGDVAVLALRREDVEQVRRALTAAGVPAVGSVLDSVFASPAAGDWRTLLTALTRPGSAPAEAAAALTPFVGWDAWRLATAGDVDRDRLAARLRSWSRVLAADGVAGLLEAVTSDGLHERLVALPDGPRRLTDTRHVAEVLHDAASRDGLGGAAVLDWLTGRIAQAADDYAEERSRRLETDARAVQVMTVHAAKGLQFPVVLAPFLWDRASMTSDRSDDTPVPLRLHRAGRRVLDVRGDGAADHDASVAAASAEACGEDLRLAYVALTRAVGHLVCWWAPATTSWRAPLTRLLLTDRAADGSVEPSLSWRTDGWVGDRLAALAARAPDALSVTTVSAGPGAAPRWRPPAEPAPALSVATLGRGADEGWRRTSYSGLTAAAHDHAGGLPASAAPEPDPGTTGLLDEPEDVQELPAGPATGPDHPDRARLREVSSPLADLPGGTAFGSLVHAVLERVDPTTGDLGGALTRAVGEVGTAGITDAGPQVLAEALAPLYWTPLGAPTGGRTLAGFGPRDRLVELEFELPLAGGTSAVDGAGGTLAQAAGLLRRHLPPDDPFAGYPDRLLDGSVDAGRALRGYLTGSIDAVLRVPGPDGERYVVVDYKTNRLGSPDEPLTCWDYRAEAMVEAMLASHYPLQLLLYSVALHRFCRWRVPAYDPARHLGGGLYLFVRGMAGPDTPVLDGRTCGVLAWTPPPALVTDLSELLAGRPR